MLVMVGAIACVNPGAAGDPGRSDGRATGGVRLGLPRQDTAGSGEKPFDTAARLRGERYRPHGVFLTIDPARATPVADALPSDTALAPNALIGLRNIEKSYAHGTSRSYVLRRINARHQGRRVRLDHGAVGRRQVDAAAHHRHARQRLDRRVLLPRSAGAQARRQGSRASCTSSTSASCSRAITCSIT